MHDDDLDPAGSSGFAGYDVGSAFSAAVLVIIVAAGVGAFVWAFLVGVTA